MLKRAQPDFQRNFWPGSGAALGHPSLLSPGCWERELRLNGSGWSQNKQMCLERLLREDSGRWGRRCGSSGRRRREAQPMREGGGMTAPHYPPGAVTTCGQCSHFHPHATPPGQATHSPLMSSMCFQLHQSGWGVHGDQPGDPPFHQSLTLSPWGE